MNIRFGNMTVDQFAAAVGAKFTPVQSATLESYRSDRAEFTDPDKFHIFDDPAITISIGSKALAETKAIWLAANELSPFKREVSFYPIAEVVA